MVLLTSASVPSLLKKIMTLASRPLVEFNKYEVLDLIEALKNAPHDSKHDKANYFRLVYETLRGKLDHTDAQFRALLLPLLGDKDYEKVLDVVARVEKRASRPNNRAQPNETEVRRWTLYSVNGLRCFFCGGVGHFQANCRLKDADDRFREGVVPLKQLNRHQDRTRLVKTTTVSVTTLQRLVGKCVSFSLAVPAVLLFTREMNAAIGQSNRLVCPIQIQGCLKDEIALETWDNNNNNNNYIYSAHIPFGIVEYKIVEYKIG